jgi:hypothetical protein
MAVFFRRMVSGHNRRFKNDGVDLDLTYITPRWIAMGFPSQGFQANYRNPATAVAAFLQERHPGHHKIFNLSEESYSPTIFHGPVFHSPFPDHHAPCFPVLVRIMKEMHDWLAADAENVIAVHCLAGHGRTGVILCALFLFEGVFALPEDAMQEFAARRSNRGKGVKWPSQRRYIFYSAHHVGECAARGRDRYEPPPAPERILQSVEFQKMWVVAKPLRYMLVVFDGQFDVIYSSAWLHAPETVVADSLKYRPNVPLRGDCTIRLYAAGKGGAHGKIKELLRISLHTAFLPSLGMPFPKDDLDGPCLDAAHEKHPKTFAALVQFALPGAGSP